MKLKSPTVLLGVLAVLAGCSGSEQATRDKSSTAAVTARDVKEQYTAAAAATKSYVAQNKDEFVASMDKELKALDARISALVKKSEPYKDDAKIQADKALASLRQQREVVQGQFEKVKQTSSETWKEVKGSFSSAMTELEKAYQNTKAKFN